MRTNIESLRAKLRSGQATIGSGLFSWSPALVETAGLAGLDFLRIDSEHSWRRDEGLENLVRAAAVSGVVPIVRIDGSDPHLPTKAFEAGAGGIIVTDVESPEQAEAVVRGSKFPPQGTRGYSSKCWAGGWGTEGGEDWITWSNRELLVGIMIENRTAIEAIDEIMSVEGLDFALFGPADYSMSIGLPGPKKTHPDVEQALHRTIDAAKKAGKHIMYNHGTSKQAILEAREMGIDMIEVGDDIGLVRDAWLAARKAIE